MSDTPPQPAPDRLACPYCGGELEVTRAPQPQVLACPFCSKSFILPAVDGSTLAVAATPQASAEQPFVIDVPPDDRADELDGIRIRQISAERRSAYRARSYCLVGAFGCTAAVGQLAWMTHTIVRGQGFGLEAALYILGTILCALAAGWLFARAAKLKREADHSDLQPPAHPPDFTNLSDGSQRWRDLDHIQ